MGCTIEPNCALLSALLCSLVSVPLSAFKMAPKRLEIRAQTGFKSGLKSILGPLAELLELSWQPGGLLEASWNALGALLEAFGAQKSNWKRLLDGPRPLRRLVSALPGGQMPSQKEPRRVPNRGPKAVQAQNSKTLFFNDSCPRFTFGGQKWVQHWIRIASSTRKPSESLLEASWNALGGSWSRKNKVGIALGALLRPLGTL